MLSLKPSEICPTCGRPEIYQFKAWERLPWAGVMEPGAMEQKRRICWSMREWLYTPNEQAEILRRFPELETNQPA
jgi:hypothetical protein